MNKTPAPTLIFDSQHANPYPVVSADVTLPGGEALPTTVQGTLTINGSSFAQSWNGSDWSQSFATAPAGPPLTAAMLSQSGMAIGSMAGIVDGDTTTAGWHTDNAVPGAYLQLDLGAAYALPAIGVWSGSPSYGVYDVRYSNDGADWGTAFTGYHPTPGWSSASWGPVGKHRFWRLVLTNTPGPAAWLRELSVDPMLFVRATASAPPTRRIAIGFDASTFTTG